MARLAKVGRAETKPERDRAAISTFEFNCIGTMRLAIVHTYSCFFSNTGTTNKVFFLERFSVVLLATLSHAAVVWLLTTEAVVKREA